MNQYLKIALWGAAIIGLIYVLLRIFRPYRNFSISDFDSPDLDGSAANMDKKFLKKLDKAITRSGVRVNIISGFRTPHHNDSVGGVYNSAHVLGMGADLGFETKEDEYRFARSAWKQGFRRFGIGNNTFHVDGDETKNDAIWGYPLGSSPEYSPIDLI